MRLLCHGLMSWFTVALLWCSMVVIDNGYVVAVASNIVILFWHFCLKTVLIELSEAFCCGCRCVLFRRGHMRCKGWILCRGYLMMKFAEIIGK